MLRPELNKKKSFQAVEGNWSHSKKSFLLNFYTNLAFGIFLKIFLIYLFFFLGIGFNYYILLAANSWLMFKCVGFGLVVTNVIYDPWTECLRIIQVEDFWNTILYMVKKKKKKPLQIILIEEQRKLYVNFTNSSLVQEEPQLSSTPTPETTWIKPFDAFLFTLREDHSQNQVPAGAWD